MKRLFCYSRIITGCFGFLNKNQYVTCFKQYSLYLMITKTYKHTGQEKESWLVAQSCAVIRLSEYSKPPPFMLLRFELGTELLKTLISGATIPFIKLRELQHLNLPIPSLEDSLKGIEVLEKEEKLQQKIIQLQDQQSQFSKELWTLEQ